MDIQKTWMLLQIESLSRLHPKLAAITNDAMNQLAEVAADLGPKPEPVEAPPSGPKSIPTIDRRAE